MKEIEVYAVITASGYYDDYHEKLERLYTSQEEAKKFANELDESHVIKLDIDEADWDEILDAFYVYHDEQMTKLCAEAGIPKQCLEVDDEDYDKWIHINDKISSEFPVWGRQYVTDHFDGKYTAEDFDKTEQHYHNIYQDWHPTKVKPVTLVIDDNFTLHE